MRPSAWSQSVPGIAEDFDGVWLFQAQDFLPNHLTDDAGDTEKVRVAIGDGLASDGLSVTAGAQVLPRAGVIGQRAEGNAGTIGALGVVFVEFTFFVGYAGEHDDLIENIEVTRPVRICGGAARIHRA